MSKTIDDRIKDVTKILEMAGEQTAGAVTVGTHDPGMGAMMVALHLDLQALTTAVLLLARDR